MAERILVAEVGLDSRMAGSEAVYTYRATPGVKVGEAYMVPLGPRQTVGYVLSIKEMFDLELGFPVESLKGLGTKVGNLSLPAATVDLVFETAKQTLSPVAVCLSLATPPGIKDRLVKEWRRTELAVDDELTTAQDEILRNLAQQPMVERKGTEVPRGVMSSLRALRKRGLVEPVWGIQMVAGRKESVGQLQLTLDSAKVDAYILKHAKKRPAQVVTLMRLQGSEGVAFNRDEIKALGQVSDATLKTLVKEGMLVEPEEGAQKIKVPPTPNEHQQGAIDAIQAAIRGEKAEQFLLYGVTGSGKTEVFLRSAEEALSLGKQILYLVPEIALTAQVVAQLRERFGNRVAVLHSNLSPTERMENWLRVASGEAPVVLGPRSALFAPLHNLGLIVVDEEHEASYKQENAPRYHTKQLAVFLGSKFKCPVVMGSATPSVESFYAAHGGAMTLLKLPIRAASAQLPEVFIEDLREGYKDKSAGVFSPRLRTAIEETLARDEQVILFLNRRAFAPFVVCRDCGKRYECPNCAVALALHRRDKKLRCHHCDFQIAAPEICDECESEKVKAFGIGAERVEEAVGLEFEKARVARLDRDIARKKGVLEDTIARFRTGELNVLVGTQMVAKGLDFPNVTLVGVIAADISLGIPDFRASERTFQLLSQVAGRAGRGMRAGRVVIQTLSPEHPAVKMAQLHDYESFYASLIQEREEAQYPPFTRLVNVIFTGPDQDEVYQISAIGGQKLKAALADATVLGPVDCPLSKLSNLFRRHVLIKLAPGADVMRISKALDGLNLKGSRVTMDVDPYNLV
jgi:primosomal protein N' (replication factor Y) (superfamily II helicase)